VGGHLLHRGLTASHLPLGYGFPQGFKLGSELIKVFPELLAIRYNIAVHCVPFVWLPLGMGGLWTSSALPVIPIHACDMASQPAGNTLPIAPGGIPGASGQRGKRSKKQRRI